MPTLTQLWANPMIDGIVWVAPGIGAYLFWARYVEHTRPYARPQGDQRRRSRNLVETEEATACSSPSQACDQFKPGGLPDTLRVNE